MINLSLLLGNASLLISGLVFIAGLSRLVLIIYKLLYKQKLKSLVYDFGVFIVLFLLTAFLCSFGKNGENIRLLIIACFSLSSLVLSLMRIFAFRKRIKNSISSASIKQSFDNLETGIMFTDASARAVLTNKKIALICLEISGTYPQTEADVFSAFEKTKLIDEEKQIYGLDSGKVLQLNKCSLFNSSLQGYSQITVQDVTELYGANVLLKKENEDLKQTNEKIVLMLERLSDRIREQETLALKTQIHNDIGVSLIELNNLIRQGETANADEQISLLQNAVGYFSFNRVHTSPGSMAEVGKHAESLGVKLFIDGDYADCEELVSAAAEVCLTNCVYHASGNEIYINISENEGVKQVIITNNGLKPDKPIVEGGGLSSLRKEVESAGAKMRVESEKEFALILELEEKS